MEFILRDVLLEPKEIRIVAGTQYRLDSDMNTFSAKIESFLIHENFSRSSLENNIAIGYVS